jgi:hypothetical protein
LRLGTDTRSKADLSGCVSAFLLLRHLGSAGAALALHRLSDPAGSLGVFLVRSAIWNARDGY